MDSVEQRLDEAAEVPPTPLTQNEHTQDQSTTEPDDKDGGHDSAQPTEGDDSGGKRPYEVDVNDNTAPPPPPPPLDGFLVEQQQQQSTSATANDVDEDDHPADSKLPLEDTTSGGAGSRYAALDASATDADGSPSASPRIEEGEGQGPLSSNEPTTESTTAPSVVVATDTPHAVAAPQGDAKPQLSVDVLAPEVVDESPRRRENQKPTKRAGGDTPKGTEEATAPQHSATAAAPPHPLGRPPTPTSSSSSPSTGSGGIVRKSQQQHSHAKSPTHHGNHQRQANGGGGGKQQHSRPSSGMSIGAHSDISATSTEAQPLTSSYRVPARALSPLTHRPATGNHHHQHAGGGNAAHIHRAHDKVVLDLQRLLFEQLPPTILPTSSSTPVKGEGMTCVSAHPELAKLVTIANQQIQALPAALAHVVREDSQRSREVMLSLCTFLDAFVQQAGGGGDGDAHVSSSPATSSPANASDRPRGVEMHRPHRSNRTSTARNADGVMSSLFPTPTVVQAVPSVDGSRLDVARVTHDGSRRILLQQVPLSVELAAIALEEKRSALHAILGTQQPLQNTGSNFVDQSTPASGSPAKALLAKRANGNAVLRAVSPPGAAVNRSHSSTDNEGEPISSVQYAPTISDAMQAVKTFSRLKVAANDVAIAQEHAALVQLYLDAVNTQSATGGDSTTTPSNAKRMTDALDAAHEDLNRQLHDVDLQLRELRNIPSNTAVSKAHRVSRQVTVDKEELLGRDRLMIRSGLDMVALCIKERSSHAQLVKEERRTFQASAQSLRSSTVGRDDEVTSKNAQLKQLAAYYRECTGENEELRRMVQVLLKHHEDLERRIEASKRLPPHPSHQRSFLWGAGEGSGAVTRQGSLLSGQQLLHSYNTLLNESVDLHAGAPGHRPTTGGCGGSQRASPDNGQNNTTQHLHDSTVFTMTQRSATTNNNNNSRGGSPSSRPMSPSSEIFHVAPNLSQPRRLSTPQQSDLSSRLHDAPVRIRRSYDEVVKSKQYAKQRAMPPPSLCTKSHGSLSPDLKKRKGSRSGEDNQHGDEDVENDGDNNNDDDDDDAAATAPSIEELNTRFYQDRKDSRRKLMDRLLLAMDAKERESEAQRPLRLKGRPGFTAEDLGANVEHLYRGSMAQQIATRAKLFEELVLEKERPYSPKKLGREELDEAIKRLSTTK